MPELPEVEVLVRHLRPAVRNRTVRRVHVHRAKVLGRTSPARLKRQLIRARFTGVIRRGKYLLFKLDQPSAQQPLTLVAHLGMTGRIYLARRSTPLPKHAAVVLELDRDNFIFEDTRYFGRFTLDPNALPVLGPEPMSAEFTTELFARNLQRSRQPIKVRLLDQTLVAGIGNIYASEALFRARISPRLPSCKLNRREVSRLRNAIRRVLAEAIRFGSTVPLSYSGETRDGLFYFGRSPEAPDYYEERLRVYDRAGQPCPHCARPIRQIVQAARSTFYCPNCQRR